MEYSIRTVREQDAESIARLLNAIIETGRYTIMNGPISTAEQMDYIRSFPERGVFNVAVEGADRRILGLISVEPASTSAKALRHVGDISTFVSLAARRKGIGHSLMRAALEGAAKQGYTKIIAMIRADNPDAVAFYTSQGFQMIGTARKHAFVNGRYVDEIWMETFLDQAP